MSEQTWIDKSAWGDGPWQDEPDRVEWYVDGVACLALRHPGAGHWCGYAAVPPGHRWHGLGYSACYSDDCPDGETCPHYADVEVHGGITFAEKCAPKRSDRDPREQVCHVPRPGEPDDVWWLGFDFHHAWDIAPAFEMRKREAGMRDEPPGSYVYRDIEYVKGECESVARQILAAQ
jgi:hypothetical protein